EKEKERDLHLNKYHYFEYASAALQIAIVLCSAAVITGAMALVWLAGATGLIGGGRMGEGFFFSPIPLLPGGTWTQRPGTPLLGRRRRLHAPAHPHEVAIEPPGIARPQHVGVLADPPLHGIDHGVRPVEAAHHQRVEPREPGELHQLGPRDLEH